MVEGSGLGVAKETACKVAGVGQFRAWGGACWIV